MTFLDRRLSPMRFVILYQRWILCFPRRKKKTNTVMSRYLMAIKIHYSSQSNHMCHWRLYNLMIDWKIISYVSEIFHTALDALMKETELTIRWYRCTLKGLHFNSKQWRRNMQTLKCVGLSAVLLLHLQEQF